jgi:redox-sensitive bicupin YhaK (pirin superfamily)
MTTGKIINISQLGFPWETQDPFLFCAYHKDDYPKGTPALGPEKELLRGRRIGSDFDPRQDWRMYHGEVIPGFPYHPHRGFETVTVAVEGAIDHADSMGAAGRFRNGDAQWMTAGKGILHSEMFPLLNQEEKNPLELFQIWLNLPKKNKMVEPHFKMLWSEDIPILKETDEAGNSTEVTIIAGNLKDAKALTPTPDSWAATPENEVAIWTIKMEANSTWTLPKASAGLNRTMYLYRGDSVNVESQNVPNLHSVQVQSDEDINLKAGSETCYLLLLQGKAINEPVAKHGPFVMNTRAELQESFDEYQRTQFGGWPWETNSPVHDLKYHRFAKFADGTEVLKSE